WGMVRRFVRPRREPDPPAHGGTIMTDRRTLLPVALLALTLFGGCTRGLARRDPGRPIPPVPSQPDRELARQPVSAPVPPGPPPAAAPSDLAAVRKLVHASAKRYADVPDFEARLVKQEVVKGKQLPKDEIAYRFRQKPMSVYMKVLSEAGQGREVMYVQGHF